MNFHHNVCGLSRQLGLNELSQCPCEQIRRARLDSTLGQEDGACRFGFRFVLPDHVQCPGCFAGTVEIMSASFCACLESVFTILSIRSHGGNKNVGFPSQCKQVCIIEAANLNFCEQLVPVCLHTYAKWHTRLYSICVQRLAFPNYVLQLFGRTTGNSPFQICREVSRYVLCSHESSVACSMLELPVDSRKWGF